MKTAKEFEKTPDSAEIFLKIIEKMREQNSCFSSDDIETEIIVQKCLFLISKCLEDSLDEFYKSRIHSQNDAVW